MSDNGPCNCEQALDLIVEVARLKVTNERLLKIEEIRVYENTQLKLRVAELESYVVPPERIESGPEKPRCRRCNDTGTDPARLPLQGCNCEEDWP
jgi:hypothetical protein